LDEIFDADNWSKRKIGFVVRLIKDENEPEISKLLYPGNFIREEQELEIYIDKKCRRLIIMALGMIDVPNVENFVLSIEVCEARNYRCKNIRNPWHAI
jgi:hypothetical protein